MGIFKLNKNNIGAVGEKIAVKFLKKKSYKIVVQNWCNEKGRRVGEIDIIARDVKNDILVFAEVKTRQVSAEESNTLPEEQITNSKLMKLNRIAEVYIKENELWEINWRIDAVSILIVDGEKDPRIKHIESIFL